MGQKYTKNVEKTEKGKKKKKKKKKKSFFTKIQKFWWAEKMLLASLELV